MFSVRKWEPALLLAQLKPTFRWGALTLWVGGLASATLINGGPGRLEHPAALLLTGIVLSVTAIGSWAAATNAHAWHAATQPGSDQRAHAGALRKCAFVAGALAAACFFFGVGRLVGAAA